MAKKKTFSKLRAHLTSTELDEKAAVLENITRMPTNNTAFVFQGDPSNPQGNSFETITDGETDETDYNIGENPTSSTEARDTTGLFNAGGDHSKGEYVKTVEPPGDTSYVLGPMAAMYYTWSYPWTMIGYIRESDRRMVNLGRIDGKLSDWDGSSGNASSGSGTFYSYGQLTTEQAIWFRDIQKAFGNTNDPATYSYRAFYPGPPSATPDAYGRYPCILTGVSKKTSRTVPDATPLDKQAGDNFSAIQALKKGFGDTVQSIYKSGKQIFARTFDDLSQGNLSKLAKATLNVLDGFAIQQQLGDYIFKGLPKGVDYLPDFTGGGPKMFGGKKWADILPFGKQLAGDNYATQYFTPSYHKALDYAKADGTIVVMPKTDAVRGLKNPFKRGVSRGFGFGDIEKVVKSSDAVANKNLTKVLKVSDPNTANVLKDLASKGIKNNKILSKVGKAVPFLNAGLVAADVTSRIKSGDTFGAVLGAAQIIPGPIGWVSLAAQTAYDVDGHFNKNGFKNTVTGKRFESYIMEQDEESDILSPQEIGKELFADGLPEDKNEFIKTMGTYLTLQGVNPEFLSILLLSIGGQQLSPEQEGWVKENIPKIAEMMAVKREGQGGEEDEVKEGISLERKRQIFGHLTQPVVLPETKQKTYKVSPGQRYKDKNKKPEETNFQDMDKLFNKNIGGPQPFKPQERTSWTKDFIAQNVMKSQEKMNGVLEMIGDGKHAFEYAMNDYKRMGAKELEQYWGKNPNMYSFMFNGKKYNVTRKEHVEGDLVVFMEDQKGVKSNMLQSELNLKLQEQNEKWIEEAYFKCHPVIPEKKESTYELIKRRFLENKKIAPEFPAEPPPKMVNGYHPEYGKKKAQYYKKLDPASANAMPLTGDPETDEIVRKQKTINKIKSMKKK